MKDLNFFPDKSKKIAVGLSGGVDSSVAAVRLVKMGYKVVGFWMWLSDGNGVGLAEVACDGSLRSPAQKFFSSNRTRKGLTNQLSFSHDAVNTKKENFWQTPREPILKDSNYQLATKICQFLKIPFYIIDLRKEFAKAVINYFLEEYKNGRTPNPCIVCNQKIKFGRMLEIATEKLKADYLATGHYARITINKSGIFRLLNGIDKNKDQSYFLYTLDKKKLAKVVFPNGSFFKKETRELAKKWQLPTKDVAESENICFIKNFNKNRTYKDNLQNFLSKNLKPKSGLVVDTKGNILGTHKGLCFYTIGNRGGWQIKVKSQKSKVKTIRWNSGDWPRLYVVRIDKEKNQLVVGTKSEASKKEFEVKKISWTNNGTMEQWDNEAMCLLKIRSAGKFLKAKLKKDKKSIKVFLEKPELGIAPGQSAVFYQQYPEVDSRTNTQCWYEVIGGGVIK